MQKKLFNIFFYLFFIFMINREFNPFGIDLRIIGAILAILLIILGIKDGKLTKEKIQFKKIDYFIISFFTLSLLSNVVWLFNNLDININNFLVVCTSYICNFIFYITFKMYSNYITIDKFSKAMKISVSILMLSMLLLAYRIEIPRFLMSDYNGYVIDLASNFLGDTYRFGGFAQDPNYASLFVVFGFATEIYTAIKRKININYLYLSLAVFCFLLSASKTTLIAIIPALIFALIKTSKFKQLINYSWVPIMILVPIMLIVADIPLFKVFTTTMNQRFSMWEFSLELFAKSPLIGNGLTSIRSYLVASDWWYVQCHSTIFQMLSETGLITLIIFGIILTISLLKNNKYLSFIVSLFSIFMITTETAYHVYFIFILAVLPIIIEEGEKSMGKKEKATVFVVNSLSNGGAERVVANLANKMVELGKNVYIYILNNKITYKIDDKVNVIPLYKKEIGKLKKPFLIPLLSHRLTKELEKLEQNFEIELYTSHLKFSNYVSRFSKYTNKCIYVMHIPFSPYGKGWLYEKKIKFIYNNQNIMTVSKGVENEIVEKYNIKVKNIETIYNPIDVEEISKKCLEKIDLPCENYILFCGRFSDQKRPLMAIDIFYKNNLYKKYNLVMLGQGELVDEVKAKINEYGISDKVYLSGWCTNPYAYMKNSLMLLNCSKFEAFPMTMIEAFSCECKVVSFDINYGPNEILIDDLSKYLVEDENIKQMGEKVNLAIKEYPKKLKERVKCYQTENVVNNYYSIANEWSKNEN